jgi:Secretion system C-terminal sorting domain
VLSGLNKQNAGGNAVINAYEFALNQNYPNPFNPSTTISFSLKEKSFVTLKVFDILGKEVSTVVNEQLPTGTHQIEFDGSGLKSGIYFYEIRANYFRDVKKLLLLK